MESPYKLDNYANIGGINSKVSPYTTSQEEFLSLVNVDFTVPAALKKRPGTTMLIGTTVQGRIGGLYEFTRLSGFSRLIVTANTNAYYVDGNNLTTFRTNLQNNALSDFVTFVDRLFVANGFQFFKYDGTSSSKYSLPHGTTLAISFTGAVSGFTGLFQYAYGYLNDRGFLGGVGPVTGASIEETAAVLTGFTLVTDYGITAIAIYRTNPDGVDLFDYTLIAPNSTLYIDTNTGTLGDISAPTYLWFTLAPKYIEIANNSLFHAGYTSLPSTVYFSDVGEPEGVEDTSFFEVRTNDGDMITGLKAFTANLMIFKRKSFHTLLGDNANNYQLRQESDQYGCLSNRAIASYEDLILFLDEKGIVEYNGAQPRIISNKIEPIFKSMNIIAARDNSIAVHVKDRNEIWFAIPCNGATFNNCVVAYDYLLKAFTTYEGNNISSLAIGLFSFQQDTIFYGGYTGSIHYYGSSLLADDGRAITCLIQTRFVAPFGQSIESQFRRLFVNVEPVTGLTSVLNIEYFKDFDSSAAALTRSIYQATFQTRVDFGIPAKSLSVQITNSSTTDPLVFYGYALEYRKQRDV